MKRALTFLLYFIPAVIWLSIVQAFYDKGQLYLDMDTKDFYFYTNYFLNHIARGVYPLWNPFSSWGRPDDLLALMIGVFNPFLYLVLLLTKLGVGFTKAYYIYLIGYFSLGVAGAVLLARHLFKNPLITWFVFISVLFSNLDSNLFYCLLVILIYVPAVWFFYFLVLFKDNPQKRSLLGITFSLMIILTTYMPFHFLVVLAAVLFLYAVIYFNSLRPTVSRMMVFLSANIGFVMFCILSLLLSLTPGLYWYQSSIGGGFIASWRGGENPLVVVKEMIDVGNIISMHALQNLVSNLQDYGRANVYLPMSFILIFLMSIILPITKRRVMFVGLGVFLILLCLLNAAYVHGFFFEKLSFFKYFRNVHFLFWGFSLIVILFIADLLQGLLSLDLSSRRSRLFICLFAIVTHVLVFIALSQFWSVIPSSLLTCVLSALFFCLYWLKVIKPGTSAMLLFLAVVFLLQPIEVRQHIAKNTPKDGFMYSLNPASFVESRPVFSYLRPSVLKEQADAYTRDFGDIKDRSGFPKSIYQYQGTRWSFRLIKDEANAKALQEYVQHKFVLYGAHQNVSIDDFGDLPQGAWISHDSPQFKVEAFDMNSIRIRTNFPKDYLLVYNDNFYDGWRASINGRDVPIIRANVSFKGVYLPAGNNSVSFSFHHPFLNGFLLFLIVYFHLFLLLLIMSYLRRRAYAVAA